MRDKAEIGGVALTHPDRVLFSGQGLTKADLAHYLFDHRAALLAHLKNRPLSLVRCPSGEGGACFFQKHHTASSPDEIGRVEIEESDGAREPYLVIEDAKGLVAAAQIGALEFHIWGARADKLEKPDRLVFDLDPGEGAAFAHVREAACDIRDALAALDLQSFALLTGGKGVHVVVPLERRSGWAELKAFAKGFAERRAAADPDRYVAVMAKAKRKGKIFIDWFRNTRGATAIAPYSPRARPGAPCAAPVSWEELSRIDKSAAFTMQAMAARLAAQTRDPWDGYFELRQSLSARRLKAVT